MSTDTSIYGAIFGGLIDGLPGASIGSLIGSTQNTNNPIGDLATNGAVQLGVGIGGGAAIGALAGGGAAAGAGAAGASSVTPGAAAAPIDMAPMQAGGMPLAIGMPAAPDAATVAGANSTLSAASTAKTASMLTGVANNFNTSLQQNAAKGEEQGQQMVSQYGGQNQTPGMIPMQTLNLNSPTYKTIFGN